MTSASIRDVSKTPESKWQYRELIERPRYLTDNPCTDILDNYAGAPIGLQITGKHMRDEETVQAVAMISKLVRAATTAS